MACRWSCVGIVAFLHLTDAFIGPSSHHGCWVSAPPPSRCHAHRHSLLYPPADRRPPALVCCDANANREARDGPDALSLALGRLELSEAQTTVVLERLQKVWKAGVKAEDKREDIERTLTWLEEKLGLDTLQALVAGHPPVLTYDLDAKLKPTIAFFYNALSENMDDVQAAVGPRDRLARFLVGSPSIIEYSVAKRLEPRLTRVREELQLESVDEEMLRAIASKTDARFEEWLNTKRVKKGVHGGERSDSVGEEDDEDDEKEARERDRERQDGPAAYVVVSNLQSGGNIGNILRSASIFGCEECLVVGQRRYKLAGDHGSRFDLRRRHMWSHTEARDYLHERGVRIYGVEITPDASPIMRYDKQTGVVEFAFGRAPECEGAAFIFGNEGQGLSSSQREICDEFLFIPQTRGGPGRAAQRRRGKRDGGGSASMNVACAAAVVLQAYCLWAGYSEAPREGEKFLAP